MLEFQCPSCKAKCAVGDEFRGRKLRCPKCRTRIRHHQDGTIELLSVGDPSTAPTEDATPVPSVAAAPPPSPPVAPAPSEPPPPSTGLVTKLTRKSESHQNTIVLAAIGGALVAVIVVVGLLTKDLILSVAALAAGFAAAFVALYVRSRRKVGKPAIPKLPAAKVKDDEPTQPLITK